MQPDHARTVAKAAYIFLYPLVVTYGAMYRQAVDTTSASYGGGFGRYRHVRTAPVGAPVGNGDRGAGVRSSVWLDVRSEPLVLTPPKPCRRLPCVTRWADLWTFAVDVAAVGDNDGRSRGSVVVAAPTWEGRLPDDVDGVVRGESPFVCSSTTTHSPDPVDVALVIDGLNATVLEPLSRHVGRPAPRGAPPIGWWPWTDGIEATEQFWSCASFALALTTPHPRDRLLLERIAEIGVVAGRPWDPRPLSAEIVDAIDVGVDDAVTDLLRAAAQPLDPTLLHRSRNDTDSDYFTRALAAMDRRHPCAVAGC